MYDEYDQEQGLKPAIPIKKYPARQHFIGLGICQIIFGVINAATGVTYICYYWDCYYSTFCPRRTGYGGGYSYIGSGIWSGVMLVIAGSVACRAGVQKTIGWANGTIATSVLSLVTSGVCIGFTSVAVYWSTNYSFRDADIPFLYAQLFTLTSSSSLAFIISGILIFFGVKGLNSIKNSVYPGLQIWGFKDGKTPGVLGMVDKHTAKVVIPTQDGPLTFLRHHMVDYPNDTLLVEKY